MIQFIFFSMSIAVLNFTTLTHKGALHIIVQNASFEPFEKTTVQSDRLIYGVAVAGLWEHCRQILTRKLCYSKDDRAMRAI